MDELTAAAASSQPAVAGWDGATFALKVGDELTMISAQAGDSVLDLLPSDAAVPARIYWPLEALLVRSFSMPLLEPKMLDAAMLSQEVAELTGEEEESWWLTWQAGKSEGGITGLVFGLSQNLRHDMQGRETWQNCPQLVVDGWERLQALRGDLQHTAVVDEDEEGVFFGYFSDGIWRGMRRLNRQLAEGGRLGDEELAVQVLNSWQAMGMDIDADPVVGRLGSALAGQLRPVCGQWQADEAAQLSDRHSANFELFGVTVPELNLRHGKWTVRKQWKGLQSWKRPLLMAAGLAVLWGVATAAQIVMLKGQADTYQARVVEAFHRGLPNETVMLDPLAQLRRAAGSSAGSAKSAEFLNQLQLLSQAWREKAWQLSEFSIDNGVVQMSGSADDIDSLNKIRDRLSSASGREVTISDTDLTGSRVSFRMKW